MKIGDLSMTATRCLAGYALILCLFNILSIVRAASMRVYRNIWIQSVSSMVLSLMSLWVMDELFRSLEYHTVFHRNIEWIYDSSIWWLVLVILVATAAYYLVYTRNRINIESRMIPFDLYEGLNQMSDGISFSNQNGVVLMVNKTMYRINQLALNSQIFNANYVRKRFEDDDLCEGCSLERTEKSIFLHLNDESVWDIRTNQFKLGKKIIDEYIFYDVTEEYTKRKELNVRYQHLNMMNQRIREYHSNIDRMVREQEILNAKINIHNDVGRSLLALRRYLTEQSYDREKLVQLWKFTIDVLKKEPVSEEKKDRIEQLIKAGKAVGVEVVIDGYVKCTDVIDRIIATSIHESITNTVKHGSGNKVHVVMKDTDETVVVEITNNGVPPERGFEEKGGLLNLRNSVEMVGGNMTIQLEPEFLIRLTLDKKWEGNMNYG